MNERRMGADEGMLYRTTRNEIAGIKIHCITGERPIIKLPKCKTGIRDE